MNPSLSKNNIIADRVRQDKYRIFNKELAHYIGLNESIYLAYLIDQDHYFNGDDMGKPFYKQQYYIFYETSIKEDSLRKLNKKLVDLGVLTISKQGLPAKNFFIINYDALEKVLNESIINFQSLKIAGTSSLKSQELDPVFAGNINNKDINNKDSFNKLKDNDEEEKNLDENIKEIFSNTESSLSALKEGAGAPAEEKTQKPKGGLAPLINMIYEKYNKERYPRLTQQLIVYLKMHIGKRRLPSTEKWCDMLDRLENYSSIQLPGAGGNKFLENNALEIVNKAINMAGGAPYPDFDDIFHAGMGLNEGNIRGY